MRNLLTSLRHKRILNNALKVSFIVGTLINLINQGDSVMAGHGLLWGHALMNYLVPFCVSIFSATNALKCSNTPPGNTQ